MATKNLSIKYRPVRIGFAVRDGNIDDLVTAAGINTLLYGGIYNPFIPVSADTEFAERLLTLYNVDVLYAVSQSKQVDDFVEKYPLLRNPFFVSTNMFYEDGQTKKSRIMYLDSFNIIQYIYEQQYKGESRRLSSHYALPTWDDDNPLKGLFSVSFGYYPTSYNLHDDFESWYYNVLQAATIRLDVGDQLSPSLTSFATPISLTATGLEGRGDSLRDSGRGIYVGDENDFKDLYLFWNLRAVGKAIEFLPQSNIPKFEAFIKAHLKKLEEAPDWPARGVDFFSAYCQHSKYEAVKKVVEGFQGVRRLLPYPCDDDVLWNGLNLEIKDPYFGQGQTLADVGKSYDRYAVAFNLPEMHVIGGRRRYIERQSLIASIDPMKEGFDYPRHTLKPPFIRRLNGYYGVEILKNAFRIKSEREGIRVVIEAKDYSLSLAPIPHQSLVEEVFKLAGIRAEVSQPGVLAKQIIQKLGGLEGGRVFKITGVRRLLNSLRKDDSIARTQATKIIREEGFEKFERLRIEPREEEKLTPEQVFSFLLKKEFFRAGLELYCDTCHQKNWLSLRQVDDYWICDYCGGKNQTSLQLKSRGDWRFRKSGIFADDNYQQGAIPVILTLLQLHRRLNDFGYIYSPALELKIDTDACETDFCILQYQYGGSIEVGVAECKSGGGAITEGDVANLKRVREKLTAVGLDCVLIFSKTAETFLPEEISLFQGLADNDIPSILFLNKELEPYDPYADYESDKLFDKYPATLNAMAFNSRKLYLKDSNNAV